VAVKETEMKHTLLTLLVILVVGVVGCRALLDEITPARIPDRSKDYAEVNPEDIGGFPSLNDATDTRVEIIIKHRDTQIGLKRRAEDDTMAYKDALGFIDQAITDSYALQALVIGSPENPISLLGLLAPLGLGALAGKELFKRGKDYSPQEYEAGIAKAKVEGNNNA